MDLNYEKKVGDYASATFSLWPVSLSDPVAAEPCSQNEVTVNDGCMTHIPLETMFEQWSELQ